MFYLRLISISIYLRPGSRSDQEISPRSIEWSEQLNYSLPSFGTVYSTRRRSVLWMYQYGTMTNLDGAVWKVIGRFNERQNVSGIQQCIVKSDIGSLSTSLGNKRRGCDRSSLHIWIYFFFFFFSLVLDGKIMNGLWGVKQMTMQRKKKVRRGLGSKARDEYVHVWIREAHHLSRKRMDEIALVCALRKHWTRRNYCTWPAYHCDGLGSWPELLVLLYSSKLHNIWDAFVCIDLRSVPFQVGMGWSDLRFSHQPRLVNNRLRPMRYGVGTWARWRAP